MSSSSLYDSVKKSFSPRGENAGGLYNPLKGEPVIFQPVTDTWVEVSLFKVVKAFLREPK